MGLRNILKFALYIMPDVFVHVAPLAVLCSIFYLHYSMFVDNELVVLQSSGVVVWKIIKPIFCVTMIITSFSYICLFFIIPYSKTKIVDQRQLISSMILPKVITEKSFINVSDQVSMYINHKYGDKVEGLIIYDKSEAKEESVIIARSAEIAVYKDSILFKMYQGSRQTVQNHALQMVFFDSLILNIPFVKHANNNRMSLQRLGLISLLKYVPSNEDQAQDKMIELHKRISWPLLNIVFMFIAAAFLFSSTYNRFWDSKNVLKICIIVSLYVFLYFFFRSGISNMNGFLELLYLNNFFFVSFCVWYLRYKTKFLRKS
jgi:lipopolysaccharide export LptBFGC system permease protein LptF